MQCSLSKMSNCKKSTTGRNNIFCHISVIVTHSLHEKKLMGGLEMSS